MTKSTKVIRPVADWPYLGNTELDEGDALEVWDARRRQWRQVTLHCHQNYWWRLVYQDDPEKYLPANGTRARLAVEVKPLKAIGQPVFGQKITLGQ
jgi:hypothetical protein